MAEQELFDPLDPLGPAYGNINQPLSDIREFTPFEGDRISMPKIDFPEVKNYYQAIPNVDKLNKPNLSIKNDLIYTNRVNPSIAQKPLDVKQQARSVTDYLDAISQSNQQKNSYAKIYSYNAGPDGNAFMKRYKAYGNEIFEKIGFSPLRDNESNFNARTTKWDDFSRMMNHSFWPLFTRGFVSGPKSLAKMLKGDFFSADLEDARAYEEAAAIGQSSKGGIMGFVNNTVMNFGYTAGIITEAIAEEAVGALFAAPTGGSSFIAATANNLLKIPKIFKGLNSTKKGYEAVRNTLNLTSTVKGAREFWNASRSGQFLKGAGRALNPLENTMHAFKGFKNADNLTDLAILSKTAGGLYRDVRKINMALSEARLEAGMVENHVYDKLYNEAYIANNNEVPSNKELAEIEKQSKDASYETLLENTAIIYVSNSIVFRNITGPRGGVRNFIKSTTDDVMDIASREGQKNFGKIGKIIYDKAAKKFILEKNNLKTLAKGFIKNPLYKSFGKTVGYFKANFTEGIQENLQETIAQANQNYFLDSYQSPTLKTMLYSRAATRAISRNKSDYFSDAWSEQNPFTAKGFETFASGFAMGALAGPLNAAVPFLSSNWNRMYDKEAYTKWKTAQTNVATDLVKKLNDMDMGAFISENNQNLGKQDILSQVRNRASKKEGLDAENEIFVGQVRHLKQTGTFEIFKEKLESFKELSDIEFADAVNIDIEQVPKYRSRIDNSVQRLDKIQTLYNRVERKNPNPINYSQLNPEDANFEEKLILYNAWEQTNENMVFFNEVYDDALKRRGQIEAKYNSNPKYKNINNKEKNLLFRPEDMSSEIDMLTKELEVQKELGASPKKIKEIEEKIKINKDYFEKYFEYDKFFNRGSYSQNIADIIKETTGVEATDQDIIDYMNTNIGSKDDEQLKLKIKNNLRQSHKNYVKKLAELNGSYIFDEDTNDTFELLDDYYTLNLESKAITKYIEILNDPDAFLDVTRRNADWMRYQGTKRVKYFEDVISSEMDKVRNNALLNELANKGYYMSAEDMEEYFINGTPPKEIFNNITKEIYLPGSKEYIEIYQEYFAKREELKSQLNPKKTGIIDEAYQKQIDDLITERDAEIEKLPKSRVRVEQDKIVKKKRNETFSITEVNEQLAPNEYVELKTKDSKEFLVLFMDEAGVMHYDNIDGEIVDITKIKDRYTEGNKFTFEMLPSEIEVERISNIYKEKIKDVFKAYNEDKNNLDLELPFEEIDSDTNLDTPDLADFREDLYNKYQQEYVANLPLEEQELLAESPELNNATFEKWYSQEENKKYFDEYNNQNRPEISEKEMIFTYRGQDIDTRNLKLQDLIAKRDDVNAQITALEQNINILDDVTEKKEKAEYEKNKRDLELDVKNLNKIIAARQFSIFPKNVQDSVKRIQKLFKAQKQVETMVEVTEDDKITGLKKGQKSYRINGLFHRRMTNAMQDVIKKKYKYPGLEDLSTVFNLTIGVKGLNKSSISNFVSQLRTLSASSEDKLKGTNDLFFDKLETELLLLDEKTPQQIKLEIKKSEILQKVEKETDINKINTLYNEAVEIQNKIDGTTAPVSTDTKADIERRKQQNIIAIAGSIRKINGTTDPQTIFTEINKINNSLKDNENIKLSSEDQALINKELKDLKDQGYTFRTKKGEVLNTGENIIVEDKSLLKPNEVTESEKILIQKELNKRKIAKQEYLDNGYTEEEATLESGLDPSDTIDIVTKDLQVTVLKDGVQEKAGKVSISIITIKDAELAALDSTTADTLTKEKVREILIAEEKNAVQIDTSQSQEEIIANIKQELDKSGLPYKDVVSPKFSTYKVILNSGKEVEILKLLKMGEAPIPAYILKGKLINALENEEKIQFAKEKLAALGTTDTTTDKDYYESPYGTIAANYLFTGGKGVILSTDYLLQALTSVFPYSGKAIDNIRNKYANKLSQILKDDINTDTYNSVMQEIRDAINNTYGNEKANEIFEKILKNATGFTLSRDGNQVSSDAEKLNEEQETKINAKSTQPIADTVEDNFDTAIKQNTTIDIVNSFFAENTYQDGRDAGNFFDLVKDYLETGKKPAFDEKIITQEAYDNLFNYLKDIKNSVDSGEFYLVGNGLVVWDSNILDSDTGRRDRIAGEIDIILANKDGIFVVDIKSGEESKFLNFNSYKLDKETFSKRNEYTIQTAGYATMLEKMIDEKIAGIAMLPIERTSDKQTNKVIEAGKPTSSSIYNNVEYLRDSEGNIIENKFFDKEFKVTKEKYKINFLVPLDRNSVEKEMNKLFPKDKTKLEPGAKRALKIKFDFYRKQLDSVTDENTEQNKQKIENIKTAIEKFSTENNVSFPEDILEDINTKLSTLKKYNSVETIDTLIKKYKGRLNKSNESLKLLTDKLRNISVTIDFNNINESLDDNSSFISKQLKDDKLFKEYFDKHKLFIGKTNISTVDQNLAIDVMLASKLLSKNEVKDNLNLEEASDLIHEGVKRIQYLKINGSTDISLKDFNAYQMDIFKLISEKKSNRSNNDLYNLFLNSKEDSELGYFSLGISSINTQLAKINDEINSKFTKENVKKALEFIEKDMLNFRDALVDVYESPSIDVGIDIAQESVEEEGTVEEIEIEQELAVGDKVYSIEKDDNSVYVIKNITTKNITLSNELGKEVTIEISKFDEQYITEANMLSGKDDSVYNTTNEEESFIEDSQKTINDFVTNPTLKSESNSNAVDKTQSALRKDLLSKTKDCQ
jgi:hypothetical protein